MIVFLVVMILVTVICGPLAVAMVLIFRRDLRDLSQRFEAQKRELAELRQAMAQGAIPAAPADRTAVPAPEAGTVAGPAPVSMAAAAATAPLPRAAPAPAVPHTPRDIESILGGQWMTWLGILAIFFGTAFFLAYDMGSHPLAGTGQILTGLLIGGLFVFAGRTLGRKVGRFLSRGLLGGGIALLYLSAYAAHAFYHLVSAPVVFPFLFGVAIAGTAIALSEDSLMVVTLTQTGALLTPLFLPLQRGEDPTAFFLYLAAVTLGSVLVARRRDWSLLPLTGFLGTVILILWCGSRAYTADLRAVTALGVAVVWALHAVTPLTGRPDASRWGVARSLVVVANGLLFELVIWDLLAPEYRELRGGATALLALLYVVVARAFEKQRGAFDGPVRLSRLTGLALAALAIPIQFDLQWVTLGWSILALVLLYAGLVDSGLGERMLAYVVLALAVLHGFIFDSLSTLGDLGGYRPWINGNFLIGAASAAALGAAAWVLSRNRSILTPLERRLVTPLILTAASVFLIRMQVEIVAGYRIREQLTRQNLYLALLLTLTLAWTVYSGILILLGFLFHYRPIRFLGIVFLAVLMLKVFAFDMQELERGYRIASFVGVGLLLLLISVLYQRERRTA